MNEILQQRIEEAANITAQNLYDYAKQTRNPEASKYDEGYLDAIDAQGDFLFREGANHALLNQWISVEEALPKEDGWYLTLNINSTSPNFADTCQWNAKGKYWYTELCGDVFLHERTHWMEIPSLKGGEE